jgi:enoyl-CoA hydratase
VPIQLAIADRVAVITINRPERRNALNLAALHLINDHLDDALAQGARAVVLTGAEGHFCAGADLKELEDVRYTEVLGEMLLNVADAPVPVIAAISGACMGLGMQLATACDIRVATDDAYFAVPVAKLGLMISHWTMTRMTMFFGQGPVRRMILTAEVLDSDTAYQQGFAQRGSLEDAVEIAKRVTTLAPLALAGSKLGLNLAPNSPLDAYEAAFHAAWESNDLREGRAAFAERRSPTFNGD